MNIHHSIFSTTTVLYKKELTTARSFSTIVSVQLTRFFYHGYCAIQLQHIQFQLTTHCTRDILEYKGSDNQGKKMHFWCFGRAGAKCTVPCSFQINLPVLYESLIPVKEFPGISFCTQA